MSVLLELYHAVQACASVLAALLSVIAIYNLRQWEPQTQTASRYSNTAANQLHKTRSTQTSGILAALLSLVCSITCVITVSSGRNTTPFSLSALNAGALYLAYNHIGAFWRDKAKVPFTPSYNEGVTSSQQMVQILGGLGVSWAVSTVVYLFRAILY